ncbi:hypothetical protein [Delftia acidovorans]|uniref:Uncharacterized protein n=1 Tax=Delftia acidovorans TaxID=80866 RepID=A0AAJ2R3N9_DELAC|nr:hypothetical protein [Delftia acidovorans]MDX4956558.1 hypothetical protein [Delftia acidovorans]
MLITNEYRQGIDMVGKALFDLGSQVMVDQPTYPGPLQAFAVS